MILNIQNGIYGDSVMMFTVDWAFDYTVKESKKEATTQWFSHKLCQILGIVEYSYCKGSYNCCSNFVFSDQYIQRPRQEVNVCYGRWL